MDLSVAKQFIILALNPEKGRVGLSSILFRYSLTGALIMDLLENGEISFSDKRIIPSFRKNGELVHDMIADRITAATRNRKISFWISRLTSKHGLIMKELTNSLEKDRILRTEQKKFLNIFPYKRYWFINNSIRINIIELLRGILLHGKPAGKREMMLLGIIESSKAYSLLSRERGESKLMRKKNLEVLKSDVISSEINQAIREVQAAAAAAVTAATIATHSSH
jgi:hypothetical protein